MTLDDLKRIFLSPTLFRLDTIVAPRLVPLLYLAGLGALLLWGVNHLFWTFGSTFWNGLWGLLEIVVFGTLWLIVLRMVCEALAVFFRTHEAAVESLRREALPGPLVDDVADALHELANEVEPPPGPTSPVLDPPSGTVRRTARRTSPGPAPATPEPPPDEISSL